MCLSRMSPVSRRLCRRRCWGDEEWLAEVVRYARGSSTRVRLVLGRHVGTVGVGSGGHHRRSHFGRVRRVCLRRAPGAVRWTG